jgi:2-polyprenyl-3-methyl-5-hydroxy-6-metoxy-1,4-benzoquinol methylase
MTTLVVGPSGVGKSLLLDSEWLRRRHPDLEPGSKVYAYQLAQGELDPATAYVHYNLTHFLLEPPADERERPGDRLAREPILAKLLASAHVDRAIVLVAPIAELLERAAGRTVIESELPAEHVYDSAAWSERLEGADLFAVYERLYALLDGRDIATEVVFSSRRLPDAFAASDPAYTHHNLRGHYILPPDPATVEAVAALPGCRYQAVPLPGGVVTSTRGYGHVGAGRAATFDAIFPDSLVGASVLDVGCANGDFLFRAERHGADRVAGVELHTERAEAAQALARLLFSGATIHRGSFFEFTTDETFDHVLVLNVIHHVRNVDEFLARAARLARHRLVVEFPTLKDPKFEAYRSVDLHEEANHLPLIGVSGAGADQTYVFAPEAVIQMVDEGIGEFSRVDATPSPIEHRAILTFTR